METSTTLRPKQPDIEIHLPKTVDNPTVFMRWCFSREMDARVVEGLKKGYGYAALLVAQDKSGCHEVREVLDPLAEATFCTLPKAGRWNIGIFLFERTELAQDGSSTSGALRQLLQSVYLQKRNSGSGSYTVYLPSLEDIATGRRHIGCDTARHIASRVIGVEVPQEIFAEEPSAAAKAFANYFFSSRPFDQCVFRRRFIGMCAAGFLPYALVELIKRLFIFVCGIVGASFFLAGSLKTVGYALSPAINFHFDWKFEGEDEPKAAFALFRGWRSVFTPGALALIALLGAWLFRLFVSALPYLLAAWAWFTNTPWAMAVAASISIVLMIVVIWLKTFVLNAEGRPQRAEEKRLARARVAHDQVVALGRRQAALAERRAATLVCGEAPASVSLEALPRELQTFWLRLTAFKRGHCRPYG